MQNMDIATEDKYARDITKICQGIIPLPTDECRVLKLTLEKLGFDEFDILVTLLMEIEEFYNIEIPEGKVIAIDDTLEDLVNYISALKG